jgi:hypothetical protein
MEGDFSRLTFDPAKHYAEVLLQQGRVQLDSDWNEQQEIAAYRLERAIADQIGPHGGPAHCAGFAISPRFALDFDGVDDFVLISPSLGRAHCQPRYTIELWIQPRTGGTILSSLGAAGGGTYSLDLGTDGILSFKRFAESNPEERATSREPNAEAPNHGRSFSAVRASSPLEFGRRSHIAVAIDTTVTTIYVDGSAVGSGGLADTGENLAPPVVVGAALPNGGGSDHYAGTVGQLRFWNTVRSPDELRSLAEAPLRGDEPFLLGYWPLDQGSGAEAAVRSGQDSDGLLDGIDAVRMPSWIVSNLAIGAGRYYVDGILCENERSHSMTCQPDYPDPPFPFPLAVGRYLVYLDVWKRHLTAIEDPSIREVALGGPDTATRLKVVWQVKLLGLPHEADAAAAWERFAGETRATGKLQARKVTARAPVANHLYRVEIHEGNVPTPSESEIEAKVLTFKWSRENGSVAFAVAGLDESRTVVSLKAQSIEGALRPGDWVEFSDDHLALGGGGGGALALVDDVDYARHKVTLSAPLPLDLVLDPARHPLLRRWDQGDGTVPLVAGAVPVPGTDWIDLENGIEVRFASDGEYRRGDYWLVPSRQPTQTIEWPGDTDSPALLPPRGIQHHLCLLAELEVDPRHAAARDCRRFFGALARVGPQRPAEALAVASAAEEVAAVPRVLADLVDNTPAPGAANGAVAARAVTTVDGAPAAVSVPAGFSLLGASSLPPEGYAYTGFSTLVCRTMRRTTVLASGVGAIRMVALDDRLFLLCESGKLWEYDPNSDRLSPRALLQPGRSGFAMVAINSRLLVFGGTDVGGQLTDRTSEYDPVQDQWSTRLPMPIPRTRMAAAVVGEKAYVVGGETHGRLGSRVSNRNDEYDPVRDRWTQRAALPTPRYALAAASIEGMLLAVGGLTRSVIPLARPELVLANEEYDTTNDVWVARSPMSTFRYDFGLSVLDRRLYVIGGATRHRTTRPRGTVDVLDEYDLQTDTWRPRDGLPIPDHVYDLATLDNSLYSIGKNGLHQGDGILDVLAACYYIHRPRAQVTYTTRGRSDPGK